MFRAILRRLLGEKGAHLRGSEQHGGRVGAGLRAGSSLVRAPLPGCSLSGEGRGRPFGGAGDRKPKPAEHITGAERL